MHAASAARCGMVAMGSTAKNAPPPPAGGNVDAVLPPPTMPIGGGQIIALPLPRNVRNWVVPLSPAPPPVNVRGPSMCSPCAPAC